MYHSLIYAMHATLSSYNLVVVPLMKGSPHVSIICLIDFHDIVVTP